jgi:hypothetical protein
MASPSGTVVVDIVLFHEASAHFVLCECKSGNNVDVQQATRYRDLDPPAVVQATGVTIGQRSVITFEPMYVCTDDSVGRIHQGLRESGVTCGVLSVGDQSIVLTGVDHVGEALRNALPRSPFVLPAPHPRVLPFDADSPASDIQPVVHAQLIAEVARGTREITVRALAERSATHFAWFGQAAQGRLVVKARAAARTIVEDSRCTRTTLTLM